MKEILLNVNKLCINISQLMNAICVCLHMKKNDCEDLVLVVPWCVHITATNAIPKDTFHLAQKEGCFFQVGLLLYFS